MKNPDGATIQELHNYWKNSNRHFPYLLHKEKSIYLLKFVKKYCTKKDKILEIGCNVGRNLNCLFQAGYKKLSGIEISSMALGVLKDVYYHMAEKTIFYNKPVEDIIKNFKNNQFNLTFTMAVLAHLHQESNWVFKEIARVSQALIIIEPETATSWHIIPRKYKPILESCGMIQIYEEEVAGIKSLISYVLRIFKKDGL